VWGLANGSLLSPLSSLLSAVCCLLSKYTRWRCCTRTASCGLLPRVSPCLLSAVCCLLSAVCCLLSAVCCLLSAVCCLLSGVCRLPSAVSSLLAVSIRSLPMLDAGGLVWGFANGNTNIILCLFAAVCCLLSAVCCLLSAVCCLLSAVCCRLSAECCLPFVVCWPFLSTLCRCCTRLTVRQTSSSVYSLLSAVCCLPFLSTSCRCCTRADWCVAW
jgi:hypothetical protein